MKKAIFMTILGLLAVSFSSCIKEDLSDCNTHLFIELDWIRTDPRDNQEQVQLSVTPVDFERAKIDMTSGISGREAELRPDYYRLVGWEPAENITIAGDTVTLATGTDGFVLEPEIFAGGSALAEVYPGRPDQVLHLPMRQQTRPLCIKVYFTGYGVPLIEGLTAVLEGVTVERKIENAFAPGDDSVRPAAIRSGSAFYAFGEQTDHWYATKRLIGVDGESAQKLTLYATFPDGHVSSVSLDVTGQMFGYHTQDVNDPWCIILNVDLTELLIMTITDWKAGAESWITVQ